MSSGEFESITTSVRVAVLDDPKKKPPPHETPLPVVLAELEETEVPETSVDESLVNMPPPIASPSPAVPEPTPEPTREACPDTCL